MPMKQHVRIVGGAGRSLELSMDAIRKSMPAGKGDLPSVGKTLGGVCSPFFAHFFWVQGSLLKYPSPKTVPWLEYGGFVPKLGVPQLGLYYKGILLCGGFILRVI